MQNDENTSAPDLAAHLPPGRRVPKSGPTILIVDDSVEQIALLRSYLEPYGATMAVCDQSADALSIAEQLQPDIILLSSTLRNADSENVCRRLKDSTIAYGIPVIFISGRDEPEARVRGLRLGAVDYLAPPLNRGELLERIRIHWRGRRMHRKLKRKVLELRNARNSLETRVAERTAALQDSMEKLRDLYHNAPCGYHSLDPDGLIVQINETELRWLGYREEEVLGKLHFHDLLSQADRATFRANFEILKKEGQLRDVEYNLVRKDGTQLPVLLTATAVTDEAGRFTMSRGTIFDISERRMAEDRVRYVAHHDVLTGLLNRIAFKIASERRLRTIARNGATAAILFVDLDNFKTINDSLGHHVGDKVIVEAARRIRRCIGARDIVARFGGDEFVMLLSVDESSAQTIAQQLLIEMAQPFVTDGHELHAGATVGISMYPRDGADLDTLMRAADAAMYAGKRRQRGCVEVFAPALADEAAFRLAIASQIPVALERNQLFIEYQPQIDLDTGQVVGVESLVRWQHPVLGRLSPDQFIPIAEDSGVIHAMGEWVMRTACEALREWENAGHSGLCMAVNVSVKQLQSALFERMVADTIRSAGLRPESLELEITESMFLDQASENIRMLHRLAQSGVTLAIDDFGVGYSGLSYLQRLPLHRLKIDRSFISDIGAPVHVPPGFGEVPLAGTAKQPMAAAIISMARTLNLSVVAEGVEAPAQLQFLRAQGCGIGQGYYFARPVSKEELLRYLGSRANAEIVRAGRKRR